MSSMVSLGGWTTFFTSLSTLLRTVERMEDPVEESRISNCISDLEHRLSVLVDIYIFLTNGQCGDQHLMDSVNFLIASISNDFIPSLKDKIERPCRESCLLTSTLDEEQIRLLRTLCFSWVSIAQIFGVSRMTLYRKRVALGIIGEERFSEITEYDLKSVISLVKAAMPDCGERMVLGYLRSQGIFVQRCRVRAAIHEIDPVNTSLRWNAKLFRRPYSVPGLMSLWHIGI